jgi:hypothetical protein
MSLKRRNIGLRLAGIGVGVALLTLGLEAPAFAAAPGVASFTPTNGPEDCVVVITGTAFTDIPSTDPSWDVEFDTNAPPGINATAFAIISATEIWATVPNLTPGTAYNVRVSNSQGTSTSASTFLATADNAGGACAPTITSFTPTCASAGASVVITGTNLLEPDLTGGDVRFAPYPATEATTVQPDVDGPTSLSVVVPSGVADGAIRVNTITNVTAGQAFSATPFLTPPPDCVAPTGHTRAITLKLKKNGQASGVVSSTETTPFADCVKAVPVKIQRKPKGKGWKNAGSATTDDTGKYSHKTKGKPGKYRALAPATTVGTADCLKAKSATRTIK